VGTPCLGERTPSGPSLHRRAYAAPLAGIALLLAATALAADKKPDLTGSLTGTVANPKGLTGVTAVDRSGEDDKRYPGKVEAATGKFTVTGLPVNGLFDVILDAGNTRLEGVNLKAPPSDFEEEQPLLKEDIKEIEKICQLLNKFENEVDVVTVVGNCQHAVAILNKRRTTPFYESKPGEMIWRLEVWRFEKPEEKWIKSQEELGVIHYRERLMKEAFAKKAVTLDPALGGLKLVEKEKTLDVGKITMPDGKAGIHLRTKK
jgi:hypothetical protein